MTLPMIFPDDAPRVRRAAPVSSHEAADRTAGSRAASQQTALDVMYAHGKPVTGKILVAAAQDLGRPHSPSRLRSALTELEEYGLVKRVGFTTPPKYRIRETLWALTDGARA